MGNVDILRIFKNKKGAAVIVLIGFLALVLIAFGNSEEKTPSSLPDSYSEKYLQMLEGKLCDVLNGMDGVSESRVMITLSGGIEYIYASDNQHSADNESTEGKSSLSVLSDKQTGEKAVVVREIYPEINGVAVVCRGENTPSLTLRISNTVSTVLGVGVDKVCVIIEN